MIIAHDDRFYAHLPELFPAFDARPMFTSNEALSQETALRNGSLQRAYLMMAPRSLGLDVGPMSGFDKTKVDEAFFRGTSRKSNFLCNIGYGDTTKRFFGHMGIPAPFGFLAIMAEFLGGLGLIVGALSRVAAFGILANMVVAIATVHWSNGFFMNWAGNQKGEGFEYHLLAIALALAVIINGAGAVSIDRVYTAKGAHAGSDGVRS